MMVGMLLGILFYRPIFNKMYNEADSVQKTEANTNSNQANITYYEDGSQLKTITTLTASAPVVKKEMILGKGPKWKIIALIAVMVLFVTMVYGPIAAFLVELFPTRIRYTSMSLPYHIGNGVFGGLVPFVATLITTIPGTNHLSGLWYPIGVAALCFVIGVLYLPSKNNLNAHN